MAKRRTHSVDHDFVSNVSEYVNNNARVSEESVFADTSWSFRKEIHLPTVGHYDKVINFDNYISEAGIANSSLYTFVLSIKEFCYAKLHAPLPNYEPVNALTIRNLISAIKPFILWCISKNLNSFDEVLEKDMDDFRRFLTVYANDNGKLYSTGRVNAILTAIHQLYLYKAKITRPLNVSPLKFQDKRKNRKYGPRECKTPVIPDSIFRPLIRIAYHYVRFYSRDIIYLLDSRDEIISELEKVKRDEGLTTFEVSQKAYLARFTDCLCTASISNNPDTNKPWRVSWDSVREFEKDVTMLRNAAWTIILALSGMRLSEFLSIRSNGITEANTGTSEYRRFYLEGYLYKNKKTPKKEQWVVNDVVNDAVKVLIRLTQDMRRFGETNNLIITADQSVLTGRNDRDRIDRFSKSVRQPSAGLIRLALNDFCTRCYELHGESEQFKDYHITARQFRRTLARHIAKEPFGVIAGKLQYKHVEVAMFEGYAGQDDSFLKELNEERAAASIDFMQEAIDDINSGEAYSPISAHVVNEFRGAATEKRNLEYYLKNKRMMIYPGLFSYCFFDPDSALCLKDSNDKKEKPLTSSCRPDKCQNSCITKKHIPFWQAQIDDARTMLNVKQLSAAQKHVLEKDIEELEKAIAPIAVEYKREN